jgi:hypothetical protein
MSRTAYGAMAAYRICVKAWTGPAWLIRLRPKKGNSMVDEQNTIGLKLPVGNVSAKAVMLIKKLTGMPLSEIKQKAAAGDYLILCDWLDDDGLRLMNRIRRELSEMGIKARQYEHGKEVSPKIFDNLEQTSREIDAEYGLDECDF